MATCDINALMEAGKCFGCLPPGQMQVLQLQLLCEIANSSTPFPATMEVTQGTDPWVVSGSVGVTNFPASFGAVQIGAWSVSVDNFPATQSVSGTVTANQGTNPWTVSGTVNVANFPATQAVTQSGAWSVSVLNFPATQAVSGTVTADQGTSPWVVGGTVAVSNFPATQPVSGTVTANQGTNPWTVSGTVNVGNFPASFGATQSGAWTVGVNNFPATQAVTQSGSWTVGVNNFPATQAVTQSGSWTVTANQGTNPWVVSLASTTITGSVAVTGPLTDAQLRATPVPVSGAVTPSASASTGAGTSHFRNTAVINSAVAVKASPGKLHGYNLYNPGAALAYVHFYNVAAGSVVVGTTTPIRSVALPSTATGTVGVEREFTLGVDFSTAISIAATTTPGGSTAPSVAIVCNVEYI